MTGSFNDLNAEEIEEKLDKMSKAIIKSGKVFKKQENTALTAIADDIGGRTKEFASNIPLIQGLCSPGMRDRHWEKLSTDVGFKIQPDENFTLQQAFDMGLRDHAELVAKVRLIHRFMYV